MKKYEYKCDKCNHKWYAENPQQCPKCPSDDFEIIGEYGSKIPIVLIVSIVIGILVIGLAWMNWDNIIKKDGPIIRGDETIYSMTIERHDNYFEVNGVDIDEVGLYVENLNSGERLYAEDKKFYPCEDGDFSIRWDEQDDVKIEGKTKIKDFKLQSDAHKNACEKQLIILDIDIRKSDCRYTIMTNMDEDDIEVSLKENRDYEKGKLIWKKDEIGNATHFYVRIKGTDRMNKKSIMPCTPHTFSKAEEAKIVVKSFELYLSDIKNNRTQFTDMVAKYNPVIVFDGQDLDVMGFIMNVKTSVKNEGNSYLNTLSLSKSDVYYNTDNTKITKLKIKTQ